SGDEAAGAMAGCGAADGRGGEGGGPTGGAAARGMDGEACSSRGSPGASPASTGRRRQYQRPAAAAASAASSQAQIGVPPVSLPVAGTAAMSSPFGGAGMLSANPGEGSVGRGAGSAPV